MPSVEVLKATGMPCNGFERRAGEQEAQNAQNTWRDGGIIV